MIDRLPAALLALLVAFVGVGALLAGCGALGADRAIDEAAALVARLPCGDDRDGREGQDDGDARVGACVAPQRTVYFATSARGYLAEAERLGNHGHHAQAERFAVLARKAAEEALRDAGVGP